MCLRLLPAVVLVLLACPSLAGNALVATKGQQQALDHAKQLFWFAYLCNGSFEAADLLNRAAVRSAELLEAEGVPPDVIKDHIASLQNTMFDIKPFSREQCEADMPPELRPGQ